MTRVDVRVIRSLLIGSIAACALGGVLLWSIRNPGIEWVDAEATADALKLTLKEKRDPTDNRWVAVAQSRPEFQVLDKAGIILASGRFGIDGNWTGPPLADSSYFKVHVGWCRAEFIQHANDSHFAINGNRRVHPAFYPLLTSLGLFLLLFQYCWLTANRKPLS